MLLGLTDLGLADSIFFNLVIHVANEQNILHQANDVDGAHRILDMGSRL